jgi:hypothetical protein
MSATVLILMLVPVQLCGEESCLWTTFPSKRILALSSAHCILYVNAYFSEQIVLLSEVIIHYFHNHTLLIAVDPQHELSVPRGPWQAEVAVQVGVHLDCGLLNRPPQRTST